MTELPRTARFLAALHATPATTTQSDRLHHLLDRMRRGALLPAEAEQLAELVTDLETRTEQAYDLQRIAHQTSNRSEAERARAAARVTELEAERDRYRTAWKSARQRAEAHTEGIYRLCDDRDAYKGWLEQEQAHSAGLRAEVARLTAGQCIDSRRMCEAHHQQPVDGCPYPRCIKARQQNPPVHLAKGTNAEDCPACKGTNPDYPFLCPGPVTA